MLIRRPLSTGVAGLALAMAGSGLATQTARAAEYVPGEVVVGYQPTPVAKVAKAVTRRMGVRAAPARSPAEQVLRLPRGLSVVRAISRLRHQPGVAYAVPDYIAHAAGSWIPNDPGRGNAARGWERMQWNFLPQSGVDAPGAWANLRADRRPAGLGVTVAVLDTGVAYRNWRQFRQSPDFGETRFVDPYDFVAGNRFPLDREGHGTFITGTIAESTNNHIALAGLAYGASIMPVRVLDATGSGDAVTIARGIRYAVDHGANVINMSFQFDPSTPTNLIPEILGALRYANRRNVVVVGAAGNDAFNQIAYPAAAKTVISVGATTRDRCAAVYSNGGRGLDLVAPGGGDDASLGGNPNCHPDRTLPSISQLTLTDPPRWGRFGYPPEIFGTSMATALVSATAALVIASRTIGPRPSPEAVKLRLEHTARPLGTGHPNDNYGWGLLDAAAATSRH